jgi:flagellin
VNKGDENVVSYDSNTNTTASALDLKGMDVNDTGSARDALSTIDSAMDQIGQARAKFGAIQSRMETVSDNAATQIENLQAAHSRLADTDYASAASELFRNKALQQYQVAVLAQANQSPDIAMRLLA